MDVAPTSSNETRKTGFFSQLNASHTLILKLYIMTDLLEHIEWKSVECLNAKPSKSIGNALKQVGRNEH